MVYLIVNELNKIHDQAEIISFTMAHVESGHVIQFKENFFFLRKILSKLSVTREIYLLHYSLVFVTQCSMVNLHQLLNIYI